MYTGWETQQGRRLFERPNIVAVCYVLVSLQSFTVVSASGFAVKTSHLLAGALAIGLLGRGLRIPTEVRPVLGYILFAVVGTLLPYLLVTAPHPLYANYLFVLLLVPVVSSYANLAEYRTVLSGVKRGAAAVAGYSAINILANFDQVRESRTHTLASGARAQVDGLVYSGGVNLESSWVALGSAFFIARPREFFLYSVPALTVCLSLSSRAGLLIWAICAILAAREINWNPRLVGLAFVLMPFCVLVVLAYGDSLTGLNVVQRFGAIGSEPGSLGRLAMWQNAGSAIANSPFLGYGIGNEVAAIVRTSGVPILDQNPHNLVISNLLALGVLGGVAWLLACILQLLSLRARPEAFVYFASFLAASLIEFRGADVPLYFVIAALGGAYMSDSRRLERKVSPLIS